jgi:glycosyltransferase involved in cell wall biosynthesis
MQPDLVFIWGMWNLSKSLALEAERVMGPRVVYYLANPWPIEANAHQAYWDMPATTPFRRIAKRLLRVPARLLLAREWRREPLQFLRVACCSEAQRTQLLAAGIDLKDAPVLYEGIDLAPYLQVAKARRTHCASDDLKLLYVGILAEHKGIHTAIEALAHLTPLELQKVHLTILGSGHPAYEVRLRTLVEQLRLADRINFSPPIPRTQLPVLLGSFDALVLPSVWAEPLARIMQESLAAGMAVIGSSNGGTRETIAHGHNGLLFRASHAQDLAAQITALLTAPQLRAKLAEQAVNTAVERFDIARMVDEVEEYLTRVAEAAPSTEALQRPEFASADSRL